MTTDSDISEVENEAIDELRQRLKGDIDPEMYDDKYLFRRFLRARDTNINNAEAMMRKWIQWREKNDINNILKFKKTEVMEKYLVYPILGYDKDGCVVRYFPCGSTDILGVMASCTLEDMTKYAFFVTETDTVELKKQSEKHGKNIDKCVYIHNYENFGFAIATDKKAIFLAINIINMLLNYYPERMKACYVINVSMYFNLVFSVMKPLFPKSMLNKIHIYSDSSYKDDILKIVDADVLPAFLGGNKTDPDGNPQCPTLIKPAERVPESFYLQKNRQTLAKSPGVKKITLSRATFHEEYLEVKEAGSYLEWEFETKCRDIGFGVFYNETIDGEEKITELVPIQRIDTEIYPETGTFRCDTPGKYVIVFDNTYSWVREKEIYFRTRVLTPEEHESQIKE